MGRGKGLQKSLKIYLSRLRKAVQVEVLRQHNFAANATPSRLLSACKYPRTPSFAADRRGQATMVHDVGGPAATLADVDRFLFENFNSLYTSRDGDDDADGGGNPNKDCLVQGCSPPPRKPAELPPDVRGPPSFFASRGTSTSLLEDGPPGAAASTTSSSYSDSTATATWRPRPSDSSKASPAVPRNSVAVITFSKDPYEDFRRSMEEMVEARQDPREPLDWDFMEELLISYLELNDRCVHKHILGAFTDLAVTHRLRRTAPGGLGGIPSPPSAAARWRRPADRCVLEEL